MSIYKSETQKIRDTVLHHCGARTLDIGCGQDIIKPGAVGVDARKSPHVQVLCNDLYHLTRHLPFGVGEFDTVFSSHCLEHLSDDVRALRDWIRFLKRGGKLVLYLPDDRWYDNASNPEHRHAYVRGSFITDVMGQFRNLRVLESGDHHKDDCYSFYVVAEKLTEEEPYSWSMAMLLQCLSWGRLAGFRAQVEVKERLRWARNWVRGR